MCIEHDFDTYIVTQDCTYSTTLIYILYNIKTVSSGNI